MLDRLTSILKRDPGEKIHLNPLCLHPKNGSLAKTSISCLLAKDFINIYMTKAQQESSDLSLDDSETHDPLFQHPVPMNEFFWNVLKLERNLLIFPVACQADISVSRTSAMSRYLLMHMSLDVNKCVHLLHGKFFLTK